jgi:hypothetical protein
MTKTRLIFDEQTSKSENIKKLSSLSALGPGGNPLFPHESGTRGKCKISTNPMTKTRLIFDEQTSKSENIKKLSSLSALGPGGNPLFPHESGTRGKCKISTNPMTKTRLIFDEQTSKSENIKKLSSLSALGPGGNPLFPHESKTWPKFQPFLIIWSTVREGEKEISQNEDSPGDKRNGRETVRYNAFSLWLFLNLSTPSPTDTFFVSSFFRKATLYEAFEHFLFSREKAEASFGRILVALDPPPTRFSSPSHPSEQIPLEIIPIHFSL